ncbi:MAG: hypothetical protein Kow0062_10550 [Acidobacteriota bacterium]
MPMSRLRSLSVTLVAPACLAAVALLAGCATAFSPELIRGEIVRQTGHDPRRAFEVNLGRFTTLLLRQALVTDEGDVPFEGLAGLELAVFEIDPDRGGPALDVTRIPVRGWEPLVRLVDERRSGTVLIRAGRRWRAAASAPSPLRELVVVGSGRRQVVYARLWGSLDPRVPEALGDVLREQGPEGIRRALSGLAASAPDGAQ